MPKQRGGKDKKKTAKEIEAERMEAERLAKEALKKEEEMKYGLNELVENQGPPMLLTQWFTTACWDHEDPKKFTEEYLLTIFTKLEIDRKIKNDELEVYSNSIVYNLIHAKNVLKFDDEKSCFFVNLLFSVFINGDARFEIEYPYLKNEVVEEEVEEDAKKKKKEKKGKKEEEEEVQLVDDESEFDRSLIEISDSLEGKEYGDDMMFFKMTLGKLAKANLDRFSKAELGQIITYAKDSYFNNFRLFKYCQTHEQTEENIFLQVSVDEPYIPEPLSEAKFLGKIMTEEEIRAQKEKELQDALEAERREQERIKEEEERARKEYEEWMGLDEATIKMIKMKLAETKNYMEKRVEEKKAEYEEKAANSKAFKKRKK